MIGLIGVLMRNGSAKMMLRLALSALCLNAPWPALAESVSPDSPRWRLTGTAKVTEYSGRRCLSLDDGAASLKDFEMTDGVIDVDMAGSGARGFYNIFFRTQGNGNEEVVYLRPHKTGQDDAQQYTPVLNGAAAWQIYNGPGRWLA